MAGQEMVLLSCEMGASLLIDSQNEAFETLRVLETEVDEVVVGHKRDSSGGATAALATIRHG